jgi:myo-inositol 2-dehydrogenase / D-chiro-inositol 1-dehydrogenase
MTKSLRVGILTAAHVHTGAYVAALKSRTDSSIVGLWDDEVARGQEFCQVMGIPFADVFETLLAGCDAVVITSENLRHAELGILAADRGKHILCEKPLVASEEDGAAFLGAVERAGVKLMTAFPCRFAAPYLALRKKVRNGEIGQVRAICATNRGRCPFLWFVDQSKSGGGAMIDHVVHVADLLRDLLGEEPCRVQAQTGSNVYGKDWEDTAMLTIEFPSGIFATLDSSWSRPQTYRTWGDVTMNVIGDSGAIEMNMFGTETQVTTLSSNPSAVSYGWGSGFDDAMVDDFVRACLDDRQPTVTGHDGLQAARVALAGYRSAACGEPVAM